jgi:hypothetical protein
MVISWETWVEKRNSVGWHAWRKGQYRCLDKRDVSMMARSESKMMVVDCALRTAQ